VPNDVVLNLTDLIDSAQRELTDSQMRELELKAQVRELRSNCSFLEKDNVHLQRELMAVKVQTVAVLCNRFLIETGLLSRHPNLSLTQAYEKFRRKLVSPKKKLTPSGISLLTSISKQTGMKVRQQPVATELDNLIHELSKVIHYPRLQTRGYFCGGPSPLGVAVAMAVCQLQAEGHVSLAVTVIDGDDNPMAMLTNGVIGPAGP